MLGTLGVGDELVDGLGGKDLSGQGCVSLVKIYWIVMIVSGRASGRTFGRSGAELAKVVVEVLVHQDGPLVGCERAEERVGM